jgi:hypothetical protein
MACEGCDLPVAARVDDCSLWQAVRLSADAVRRVRVDGADAAPLSWAQLVAEGEPTPLVEPIATWGGRHYWSWSPRWEAATGQALAHLLVASHGQPVEVPHGVAADVFRRALDALLPAGPPQRRAVLAGPGQPSPGPRVDILLVPVHPLTGETWEPDTSAYPVPLPLGVWLWLVSPQPYRPIPARGAIPRDVQQDFLRDDPLPPHPRTPFRVDGGAFQHTLVRLEAVRSPWMRPVLDRLARAGSAALF